MKKPFHLMTPAERTAARIAENRAISEKVAAKTIKGSVPPSKSTEDFTRTTPEEHAGSVIRKMQR